MSYASQPGMSDASSGKSDAHKHVEAMIIALERGTGYTVQAGPLRHLLGSIIQLEQEIARLKSEAAHHAGHQP